MKLRGFVLLVSLVSAAPVLAQQAQPPVIDKWQSVAIEFKTQLDFLTQRTVELSAALAERNAEIERLKAELSALKPKATEP
jgi:septal ring factor EnvC (AmiA/AmiB activator)